MAMRACWILGVLFIGATAGCAPTPQVGTSSKAQVSFEDAAPRPGLDTVLVLTPLEQETHELWSGLVLELKQDFNIVTVPVSRSTAVDHIVRELDERNPQCVVVVDNRTLSLYRAAQYRQPDRRFPPAVVVMTSFLQRAIGGLRRATGIAYEVPAVSSIVALRDISALSVQRLGVVHRKSFSAVVEKQAELLKREKVELVAMQVSDTPTVENLEDSLDTLVTERKVDALWVLNDNRLLTAEMLVSGWLPVLDFQPIPVIVGVSALVHPSVHFGTLAVVPHPEQLGVQTANLIFDLYDNGWQLDGHDSVELPLAVSTVVDVAQVESHFGLRPDALAKIDLAVK